MPFLALSPARQGVLLGLLAAVIWGAFYTVSRHAIGAGMAAGDIAFVRYLTTALVLAPFALRRRRQVMALGWQKGLVLAFLGGPVFVIVSAYGYHFAPLSHGAVLQLGSITVFCALGGALWLGEHFKMRSAGGLLILVAGLGVVAGPGLLTAGGNAWIGDSLFILAGLMWAVFTILLKRWKADAIAATIAVTYYSAILYCPTYLLGCGTATLMSAPGSIVLEQALVQGVFTGIVALFAYLHAVHLLGAARASVFTAVAPLASILLGIVLVHEWPAPGQWLGLGIASIGMAAILAPPSKSRAKLSVS
jgi:Predicted permeases